MPRLALLALAAAGLFSGCSKQSATTGVRVDPALATLTPPRTAILIGARLDQLRETPTYQKHVAHLPMQRIDEFAKETGLDPRKDLWEVLFASDGAQSGVLMVRGKFSTGELEPKLEREGAARTQYKGYGLFGDEQRALFFMNSTTAVAGDTATVKSIIEGRDKPGSGIPEQLAMQIAALPARSQAWAVFNGANLKLPSRPGSMMDTVSQLVHSVVNGRFGADLRDGIAIRADGTCTTGAAAKQIHDGLKMLTGMGRLQTPDTHPEMLRVWDAIQVQQDDRAVHVEANIPQDAADQFLKTFTR